MLFSIFKNYCSTSHVLRFEKFFRRVSYAIINKFRKVFGLKHMERRNVKVLRDYWNITMYCIREQKLRLPKREYNIFLEVYKGFIRSPKYFDTGANGERRTSDLCCVKPLQALCSSPYRDSLSVGSRNNFRPHQPRRSEENSSSDAVADLLQERLNNHESSVLPSVTVEEMLGGCTNFEDRRDVMKAKKDTVLEKLIHAFSSNYYPDVTVKIGEVCFRCHIMVLHSYSQFFVYCNNGRVIELPANKITPTAFITIYHWMVTAQPVIKRRRLLELFAGACYLGVNELVHHCWMLFDNYKLFHEESAFKIFMDAKKFQIRTLKDLMLSRVYRFFLTLVASDQFLKLTCDEVCTLLMSNRIGVNTEIEVFMSAVRWLDCNWKSRERYTVELLSCVRFGLMPPWYIVRLKTPFDSLCIERITSHPEVRRMIDEGISYLTTITCYGEDPIYLEFLKRMNHIKPVDRQWIYDKNCSHHHHFSCDCKKFLTYKDFLVYLHFLRTAPRGHWRSIQPENRTGSCVHIPDEKQNRKRPYCAP